MKKILIIGNSVAYLNELKDIIINALVDVNVLISLSTLDGIEQAEKEQPNLIISEINIADTTNFEVLTMLKKAEQTKSVPVLIVNELSVEVDNKVEGLNLGADAVIDAPINHKELIAQIKTIFRNKSSEELAIKKCNDLEKLIDEKLDEINYQALLLSNITESVISFDDNFIIKSWNNGAEKMYGWAAEEVLGKKFQKVLNPIFFEQKHSCEIIAKQDGILHIEAIHSTKNKGEIYVSKTKSPIFDSHNNAIGNICIARDITIQKKAELEIKKLSEAVEQSPASVMITNVHGEIEYVNKKFQIKTGYSLQEVKGKNPRILSTNNTSAEEYKTLWNTISNGKTWRGEFLNRKKSGDLYWEDALIKPIFNIEEEIVNYIAVKLDITEKRKITTELIEAKEKAEESERLKSAFLANMSHEIRTPMNAILGFSELLINQNLSNVKQDKYHEIINASGKRLMDLINDIIDISKLDAKELRLVPAVFNLNKLIDQLQQQFTISPKNKNTSIITVKAFEDVNSFIYCDETRLAQIISNLLENALKFSPNGTIEFGYNFKNDELHFFVKDSGIGIDVKDHKRIFERFGQSENEMLKAKEGSGLGLAICKGIVELMGGEIWVESKPMEGATFHFRKPYCAVNRKENKIEKEIEVIIESDEVKTILIVEDDETNFLFIEAALNKQPFNLIHVSNGKEAVKLIEKNNEIDVILMDINMPIMNGLDATVAIRKIDAEIPIIALTAYAMITDKEKALKAGCTDYLSKPVSKNVLTETINKYVMTSAVI